MTIHHELRIRVRYSETDQMGVVHHASYLNYLEEGRTALMRDIGFPYEDVERDGFAMGVRKVNVRYRQAARYGDEILVTTTLSKLKGASIVYEYVLTRVGDGETLLTGSVDTVSLNLKSLRPVAIPDGIKRVVEAGMAATVRVTTTA
jgi:acyl-CoA thioester hydrolase